MTEDEIHARLAGVQAARGQAVARFDAGPPFGRPVALLPSAFNPVTNAHIELLRLAAHYGDPAALLSTRNVDKGVYGASLEHRAGMLLAAARVHHFAVLATNAARFVDQARALRGAFPALRFDFVAGYDTLVRLFEPRYYDDLDGDLTEFFSHHRLIAVNRGDVPAEAVGGYLSTGAPAVYRERIAVETLADTHAGVSSTVARSEIEAQGGTRDVPPEVAAYIQQHRLYRASGVR